MTRFRILGTTVCMSLILLGSFLACTDHSDDPESPERRLLNRAVVAAWGQRDPTTLQTYRQTTRWESGPEDAAEPATDVEVCIGPDGCYREVRRHPYGITEVFATDGETAWASVDGTVVPLSEADLAQRALQPWLVEVSRLAPLRDAERFALKYRGRESVEDIGDVESLVVTSAEQPGLTIVLQFDASHHRVRRVALQTRSGQPEQSLVLDDYRAVGGVQIAHRILAYRGEDLLKRQIVRQVELDPELDAAVFKKPLDLNRDAIKDKATGISGSVVSLIHDGDDDEVFDSVDTLRAWMAENEVVAAGPLILIDEAAGDETTRLRVGIAIESPSEDAQATAEDDEDIELTTLSSTRVLSLTHVGEKERATLVAELMERAKELGLEVAGAAIEVHFTTDGQLRQVQLPVR